MEEKKKNDAARIMDILDNLVASSKSVRAKFENQPQRKPSTTGVPPESLSRKPTKRISIPGESKDNGKRISIPAPVSQEESKEAPPRKAAELDSDLNTRVQNLLRKASKLPEDFETDKAKKIVHASKRKPTTIMNRLSRMIPAAFSPVEIESKGPEHKHASKEENEEPSFEEDDFFDPKFEATTTLQVVSTPGSEMDMDVTPIHVESTLETSSLSSRRSNNKPQTGIPVRRSTGKSKTPSSPPPKIPQVAPKSQPKTRKTSSRMRKTRENSPMIYKGSRGRNSEAQLEPPTSPKTFSRRKRDSKSPKKMPPSKVPSTRTATAASSAGLMNRITRIFSVRGIPSPEIPPVEPSTKPTQENNKLWNRMSKILTRPEVNTGSNVQDRRNIWNQRINGYKESQASNVFSSSYDKSHEHVPRKGDADYGTAVHGSATEQRAKEAAAWVDKEIDKLLSVIKEIGQTDSNGVTTVRFGDLFIKYQDISDTLVGIIRRARKRKLLTYKGDMLFQGASDNVIITLL